MLVPCYFCFQSTCSICGTLGEKRLRENNIVVDDQDLTSTELTYMIDLVCTS